MENYPHTFFKKYYRDSKPKISAIFSLIKESILTKDNERRLVVLNQQKDYLKYFSNGELFEKHKVILYTLYNGLEKYKPYDYGKGYFYQSSPTLEISGLRDTSFRLNSLNLAKITDGKEVLDIGCNSGFLTLEIAKSADYIVGIDIAKYLIDIANESKNLLKIDNAEFQDISFEKFNAEKKFDVILSLANHSTFDNQTGHELNEYFEKCSKLLSTDGLLIFESHPPDYENTEMLAKALEELQKFFSIDNKFVGPTKGIPYYDQGRTYVIGRKK